MADDPLGEAGGEEEEGEEEEDQMSPDEEVSGAADGTLTSSRFESAGSAEGDAEVSRLRRRVLQREGQNFAANGEDPDLPEGGDDGELGGAEDEEDESFVVGKSPEQRYQRYIQSSMDEVSDPDEWCETHYGFATADDLGAGGATTRSRSREGSDGEEHPPTAKAMPKPLARNVERRVAMDRAMKMMEDERLSGVEPSTSEEPPLIGIMSDSNYFLSSIPTANFFHISPVPRAPDALDDYRWDLLMQGIGPEHLVVLNCNNLANFIHLEADPMEQRRLQRLLRNLQHLLVKCQSGGGELWIEAAGQTISWLNDGQDVDVLEEPDTEVGSTRHEEGEEEEDAYTDDPSQPGDRDDQDHGDDGRESHGGSRSYDYDDVAHGHRGRADGGSGGIGGSGEHLGGVAGSRGSGSGG